PESWAFPSPMSGRSAEPSVGLHETGAGALGYDGAGARHRRAERIMRDLPFVVRPAAMADYEQLCALWEIVDALHRGAMPHLFRFSGVPALDRMRAQGLMD